MHTYIHMTNHITAIANGNLFNPAEPAGEYVLDMSDPFSQVHMYTHVRICKVDMLHCLFAHVDAHICENIGLSVCHVV